jgi:hypothetical protein
MPRLLTEAQQVATATQVADQPGRFRIQLITPGWGSSGYYGPDVLEAAVTDRVFPAGTHMYADHPSVTEGVDRPERSIEDLRAVLMEDAYIDDEGGLSTDALVFGSHRVALEQMAEAIGVSIRAYAEVSQGEAEGRRGTIVDRITEGISADFVTHAGRGGRIVTVLESSRPGQVTDRAIEHGVAEATANQLREGLQQAIREAYGAENTWLWVRDFDDANVWYEHETADDCGTYQHGYELDESDVPQLTGSPLEVRPEIRYVPVNPAGPSTTQESEEDTMPQIEEARLRQLEEDAGRVQTLESERDAAAERATQAEAEAARLRESEAQRVRTDAARRIVGEAATAASVQFSPLEERGLLADLPVSEDGSLDEAAFRTTVDEQAAAIAESRGAGRPRGFGSTQTDDTVTQDQVDEARRRRAGLIQKGA